MSLSVSRFKDSLMRRWAGPDQLRGRGGKGLSAVCVCRERRSSGRRPVAGRRRTLAVPFQRHNELVAQGSVGRGSVGGRASPVRSQGRAASRGSASFPAVGAIGDGTAIRREPQAELFTDQLAAGRAFVGSTTAPSGRTAVRAERPKRLEAPLQSDVNSVMVGV